VKNRQESILASDEETDPEARIRHPGHEGAATLHALEKPSIRTDRCRGQQRRYRATCVKQHPPANTAFT